MASIEQVAAIANEVAQARAFEVPYNFPWMRDAEGNSTYSYSVSVKLVDDVDYRGVPCGKRLILSSAVKAKVSTDKARAELRAVVDELKAKAPVKAGKVTATGFWNMGRFCKDGFTVEIKL